MSGICGQFNLDDAPVAAADLRAMTSMLEQRGPERTSHWQEGPIGLGHTLLATTPQLQSEQQPATHRETGCVITADVRLDNRDELLHALALNEQNASLGDAGLILAAYLAWDDACLDRFLGDFAFVIWDPRHRKLFCARDHFGLRPLYYHHVRGKRFLFASDARAILVQPEVPYQINQGRIADYLVPELEWIDYTSTFFEGIFRLPPGHMAIATTAGLDVSEYWQPRPGPELPQMSEGDYQQGFLEVFTKAVDARLRAPASSVGSMLSGGMDSGAVTAVAGGIVDTRGDVPLPTYSCARGRGIDCAESRAIYAAAAMPSISPHIIVPGDLTDHLDALVCGNEEPFDGECILLKSIYLAAQSQGRSVVLDGAGGDIVLNEGTYTARLLRQGRIKQAIAEIAAENRLWGETSLASDLLRNARTAFLPEPIRTVLRKLRHPSHVAASLRHSLISSEFANSIDIKHRIERQRQMFPREWIADYAVETCNAIRPNMAGGRERYTRIAAVAGSEARDPFMDKRVVEYCTRLPGHLRMKDGWYKRILRDAMAGRLPGEVLWASGKPHLGWLFNATVTHHEASAGRLDLSGLKSSLADYTDLAALDHAWRTFEDGGDADRIHTAHMLSVWLQENVNRPVAPN